MLEIEECVWTRVRTYETHPPPRIGSHHPNIDIDFLQPTRAITFVQLSELEKDQQNARVLMINRSHEPVSSTDAIEMRVRSEIHPRSGSGHPVHFE